MALITIVPQLLASGFWLLKLSHQLGSSFYLNVVALVGGSTV